MISLPAIADPAKYQGLYAFDFGDHVSLGYTAGEIEILYSSSQYRDAQAYEIYRVDDAGRFELRGIRSRLPLAPEAFCFLRVDGPRAREDYEEIKMAASDFPLPCLTELRLARSYEFEPRNLTALLYPGWAVHLVGIWLENRRLSPGDRVVGGQGTLARLEASGGLTIASCTLETSGPPDRTAAEVLGAVEMILQR